MTRQERHEQIVALRADGLKFREIADRLGLHLSTVTAAYYDPTGEKDRRRKQRRYGLCVDCGKKVFNSGSEPGERCWDCTNAHQRAMGRRWVIDSIREWAEMFGAPPSAFDWNPALARLKGCAWKADRYDATGRPWPSTTTAIHNFGSWNDAIEAAGFKPRRVGHYGRPGEDPAVLAETARLYLSGLSVSQVAAHLGITSHGVLYRLEKLGVERRSAPDAVRLHWARRREGMAA